MSVNASSTATANNVELLRKQFGTNIDCEELAQFLAVCDNNVTLASERVAATQRFKHQLGIAQLRAAHCADVLGTGFVRFVRMFVFYVRGETNKRVFAVAETSFGFFLVIASPQHSLAPCSAHAAALARLRRASVDHRSSGAA